MSFHAPSFGRRLCRAQARRIPCQVVFYAGYKGRETPRAVRFKGHDLPILEVLERRRVQDDRRKRVVEEFTCRLKKRAKITATYLDCRLSIIPFGK